MRLTWIVPLWAMLSHGRHLVRRRTCLPCRRYVAKEVLQYEDTRNLDKADMFALGASLYELASDKRLSKGAPSAVAPGKAMVSCRVRSSCFAHFHGPISFGHKYIVNMIPATLKLHIECSCDRLMLMDCVTQP